MRTAAWAYIATIGLLSPAAPMEPDVFITVPQQDLWRSARTSASASVSADGRYVVLSSYAPLVPADTDRKADIYVFDRVSGRVTLESVTADDQPLTGDNTYPRLSGDGSILVFQTQITAGDPWKPDTDIVVRDRRRNTATRVSRDLPRDAQLLGRLPAISEDGQVVAFASAGTALVPGRDENGAKEDVYTFEPATRALRRVSVDSRGVQREHGASYAPSLSGNGRYVAFTSTADLDPGAAGKPTSLQAQPGSAAQVYVRDMERGTTTRVSVAAGGEALDGASYDPVVSRDGRYIAFVSEATRLVPADRNRSADVFVRDMLEGTTTLVSRKAGGGTANGPSGSPAISADGRMVVFQSDASDLICAKRCDAAVEDLNLLPDIFLFDRTTGRITRISAALSGGWGEESAGPSLDATGTIVTFTSRHPIDERDLRNDFDLFVRIPGQIVAQEQRAGRFPRLSGC